MTLSGNRKVKLSFSKRRVKFDFGRFEYLDQFNLVIIRSLLEALGIWGEVMHAVKSFEYLKHRE